MSVKTMMIAAGVATALALSLAPGAGQAARQYFVGYYTPTDGKIGYHFDSRSKWYSNSLPGGDSCGPVLLDSISTEGDAPPGINVPGDNGHTYFEGTPQQPGDWTLRVTWHGIRCSQGNDQKSYGDRTITVQLHISGDAVRGVN